MSNTDDTIYPNPKCGTSRNTLALIRHAAIQPDVIEYLKTPARERPKQAIAGMDDGTRRGSRA
jgi:arsenate reductase (glutaredoxin)